MARNNPEGLEFRDRNNEIVVDTPDNDEEDDNDASGDNDNSGDNNIDGASYDDTIDQPIQYNNRLYTTMQEWIVQMIICK